MPARTPLDWGTHVIGPLWVGDGIDIPGQGSAAGLNPALVIDVKARGAVGDGSTDDTAAIQAALTAAVAGSTILFPKGTYLITDSLTLATGNIKLCGDGQDTNAAIHYNAVGSEPILILSSGSTRIENLTFRGDGTATGGGIDATNIGIQCLKSSDLAFADFDLYLDRVTFSRLSTGVDYRGRNLAIQDCTFSHIKDGILFTGATAPSGGNRGLQVLDCRFHSCGSDHTSGTRSRCIVLPAASQNVSEVSIQDNYVDDCEQFVVGFSRSGTIHGNIIARQSPNIAVIDVDTTGSTGQTQGWVISDNTIARIVGTTTAWTSQHGIRVTGNYFTVKGNVIVRMGGNGILCAASNCIISDNFIINPSYGTPTGGLAAISNTGSNSLITNNHCLVDDVANSGMTYGVDSGSNATYLGPHLVLNPVTAEFNLHATNTLSIPQPRGVFSTLGTVVETASAILSINSTTRGVLLPRMTTTQRDNISGPVAGLVIYNTTTNKLNVYTTAWEAVTSA